MRTDSCHEATNEELIVDLHARNVLSKLLLATGEFDLTKARVLSMDSVAGAFRDWDLNFILEFWNFFCYEPM